MRFARRAMGVLLAAVLVLWAAPGCAPKSQPATRPAGASTAAQVAGPAGNRFESAIVAFEKRDREAFPAAGGTLFVGSSTFAMWKGLEEDFRELHAINRGFGGSTIPEVLYYADRIVLPYKPASIVFFCGTNDIAGGQSPERVFENFKAFVGKVRKGLPGVRVYYVSIHTAPVRVKWAKENAQANRLIREFAEKTSDVQYIDTASVLLDGQGRARPEFYLDDRLHLNRQGQELWIPVLRKAVASSRQ